MVYISNISKFSLLPNLMFGYWLTDNMVNTFQHKKIGDYAISDGQTKTGDNDKYLRFLWEVPDCTIGKDKRWVLHVKGGLFRRWYGNIDTVIDWSIQARNHYKEDRVARIAPEYIWFREGISWNLITSSEKFAVRLLPKDCLFNLAAPSVFFEDSNLNFYVLGLLNSIVAERIIRSINPTLNTNIGDIMAQPLIINEENLVNKKVQNNINLSKADWDSFETSWGFKKHPLI